MRVRGGQVKRAEEKRAFVPSKMTARQISKAQKLAREWVAANKKD